MFEYDWESESVKLEDLKGLKLVSVEGLEKDSDEVFFNTECGRQFKMYHSQDCCESVDINDVCGDLEDLIDAEIVYFEERTSGGDEESEDKPSEYCESFTWTFYDIQTTKGSFNIRWLGESNGYYSESVNIVWGRPES